MRRIVVIAIVGALALTRADMLAHHTNAPPGWPAAKPDQLHWTTAVARRNGAYLRNAGVEASRGPSDRRREMVPIGDSMVTIDHDGLVPVAAVHPRVMQAHEKGRDLDPLLRFHPDPLITPPPVSRLMQTSTPGRKV